MSRLSLMMYIALDQSTRKMKRVLQSNIKEERKSDIGAIDLMETYMCGNQAQVVNIH